MTATATSPVRDQDDRAAAIAAATGRRLQAAADAVLGRAAWCPDDATETERGALALDALAGRLVGTRDRRLAWLLLTAVAGRYPLVDEVKALHRAVELVGSSTDATLLLLDMALGPARLGGTADREIRIVSGGVVVDLDACARSDFHNGIQRVAREVVRAWRVEHDLELVAWTDGAGITRSLTPREQVRAAHWGASREEVEGLVDLSLASPAPRPAGAPAPAGAARSRPAWTDALADDPDATTLVVPWEATVVLAEVPLADRCPPLAALAETSGNRVVAIGYDAIPVVSADVRPLGEANAFTSYLTVIKHSARVAGISTSATVEFAGFAHALASQGLPGPTVQEVQLPADVPPPPPGWTREEPPVPQVLCVGRLEPHKNHAAILHAAERLWREGHAFELTLVGADGWSTDGVDAQLADLAAAGRPLHRPGAVSDEEMWRLVREASFSVFVSLHEGFGLPVAESLACGTPVITTRYGSQGEIAAAGGCLTVDPRDDDALLDAMRRLVTDPSERERLRAEAASRPTRTWHEYAAELWTALVGPEEDPRA